jgi:hypothetical protein
MGETILRKPIRVSIIYTFFVIYTAFCLLCWSSLGITEDWVNGLMILAVALDLYYGAYVRLELGIN